MITTVLCFISAVVFVMYWRWKTNQSVARLWKGETERYFERDWEIKFEKNRVFFAVPSFKTAFWEVRSPGRFGKLFLKMPWNGIIEKEFIFDTEDPSLDKIFSADARFIETFRKLNEISEFAIVSNSKELFGQLVFGKDVALTAESPEFRDAMALLGQMIDGQFTIPLTELTGAKFGWWRRLRALPVAMLWASLIVVLGVLISHLVTEASGSIGGGRFAIGAAIFATGFAILATAWSAPAHTFVRLAGRYVFIFSWAAFLWIASTVSAIRELFP